MDSRVSPASGRGVEDAPRAAAALTLSTPQPNPAAGPVQLMLSVGAAQSTTAEVVDVLGRTVATLFRGLVETGGTRQLVVDGLAPGSYVVRVRGTSSTVVQRVTVLR